MNGGATEVDAPLSHKMRQGFNHDDGISWRCCIQVVDDVLKLKEADVIDHWSRSVDTP